MQTNHHSHDDWRACRDGELGQLVGRLKQRRRRAQRRDLGVAGLLLLVVFLSGSLLLGLWQSANSVHAGIACSDVVQQADAYLAGELDAETTERIRQHLAECHYCQEKVEARRLDSERPPTADREETRNEAAVSGSPVVRRWGPLKPVFLAAGWSSGGW